MQLKKYTDYGLRVLIYLAAKQQQRLVTIDELSKTFNAPRNHLNKVIHQLGKEGFIQTRRGKNGGFKLAMAADEIALDHVIRRLEGDEYWIDCHNPKCAIFPVCELKQVINEGKEIFYRHLAQYTVASLVKDAEQIQIRWQTEVDAGGQQEKTR